MTPLEIVLAARSKLLKDLDGTKYRIKLGKPISSEDKDAGQFGLGLPWPPDIAEILAVAEELDGGPYGTLSFNGLWHGLVEVFPRAIELLGDGCGNSWVVDTDPATGSWRAVYFSSHDPPVIVLQARSVTEFLNQYFDEIARLEWVGSRTMDIWKGDELATPVAQAPADCAAIIPDGTPASSLIVDMRKAAIGDGFIWSPLERVQRLTAPNSEPLFLLKSEC
ncbi:MAG: hypothetical protein KF699_10010 [Phycisphaeraceae bacterium]|nr:hypothetical protein [Phycisphaeraceae bacterium]